MKNMRFSNWSQEQAIGIDDLLIFYPVDGARKKIQLNRTRYLLGKNSAEIPELKGVQLWGNNLNELELKWVATDSEQGIGNYQLESKTEFPFWYNGQYTWKVILRHSDEIYLGYNRLVFAKKDKLQSHTHSKAAELYQDKIYQSSLNILIEGETGVGKTRLAKKIHEQSGRQGSFVHLNLSSFTPSLLESELFGHVKGAFTGAHLDKKGAILEANHGTLFLDEIDSLPKEIQVKLLLFLDDQKLRHVGGTRSKQAHVRLIFASGQSLESCVENDFMRKDFFYRVSSGHRIYLKSLRDNPQMIDSFVKDYLSLDHYYASSELTQFYRSLKWPGNYRQLKAHIDKKKVFAHSKKLVFDDLDRELALVGLDDETKELFYNRSIDWKELKKNYIHQAYCEFGSYKAAGARVGVTEKTVRRVVSELSSRNYKDIRLQ